MTPRRSTRILLSVFALGVVLLAVQLVVGLRVLDGRQTAEGDAGEDRRLFDSLDISEIESARLETSERILTLEKVDNDEFAIVLEDGRLPARSGRVQSFLESLLALERGSPVTSDPERHAELGVSEGTAFSRGYDYSVSLTDESGTQREVRAGLAEDSPRIFVRRAAEDSVYRVTDTISFYVEQGPVYWAELRVFAGNVSLSEVERVRMEKRSDDEAVLSGRLDGIDRSRFERVGSDGMPEDQQNYGENEQAVRRVLSLEAEGFFPEPVESVSWRIYLRRESGEEIVVNIGPARGNAYPAEVTSGRESLTAVPRPTLALRPDLFEAVSERLLTETANGND